MQNEIKAAESLLKGSGVSVLDAARLIRNALDYAENESKDNLRLIPIRDVRYRFIQNSRPQSDNAFAPAQNAQSAKRC